MDVVVLIARILFVWVFVVSAIGHFTALEQMSGFAKARGVPLAKPAVLLSGVAMLAGAVSVLLGIWGDLGALVLAATVLAIAFLMHHFWTETDPEAKMMDRVQFNKDLSLGGAALALFALFALVSELGLTVTGPLFNVSL